MRYRLEIEVGHGRYGRLYRATDLQTGRVVACKRLGETWLAVPDFEAPAGAPEAKLDATAIND